MTRKTPPRTWETNADENAQMLDGRGWDFAARIACSVEKGAGQGGRATSRARTREVGAAGAVKTSAVAYAVRAHMDDHRVLRILDAWNSAADDGLVPHSADLAPGDVRGLALPEGTDFDVYLGPQQRNNAQYRLESAIRTSAPEDVARAVAKEAPAAAAAVVRAVAAREPQAVADALPTEHLNVVARAASKRWDDEHPEAVERHRAAVEDDKAARHNFSLLAFLETDGLLEEARQKLHAAARRADGVRFDDEKRGLLRLRFQQVQEAAQEVLAALGKEADVDWDAEFRKMGESK